MTRAMPWIPIISTIATGFFIWFIIWFFTPEAKATDIVWHGYQPPINSQWMILALAGVRAGVLQLP